MVLDALILGLGSGLAGLLGSAGQSLRKPFHAGRFDGARTPGSVRALEALGWASFLAILLLAYTRGESVLALTPVVLVAALTRDDRVVRRLDLFEPGELVQLAFALTLGLVACALVLLRRWLDAPPEGAAPGVAGLSGVLLPAAVAASVLIVALAAAGRPMDARAARRARAEAARMEAERLGAR